MEEIRILSPTAILGYGFPVASFQEGMRRRPHVIAVDAGSTDPGPYYLGAGKSFTDRNGVKRDMEFMILAALEEGIPVIVGTSGGCGGDVHLQWNVDIVKEIAQERGLSFKMAVISSEISRETVLREWQRGNLSPLSPLQNLGQQEIEETPRIVTQIGHEPIVQALEGGAQVIMTGRCYDPAVFAALGIKEGFDIGLATHLGKILECAAIAADPGSGSDCMFGFLRKDHFALEPLSPERRCTTLSVAAHTLYEKTDPYHLKGPGGELDLTECSFSQETDQRVVVRGTRFKPTDQYYLKLEGARRIGYRTVSFAATKDPILIAQIDAVVGEIKKKVRSNFNQYKDEDYYLNFRLYGHSGVMSMFENLPSETPGELGIIIEGVGKTQELANTVCSFARSSMLHFGYPGRKSTAGNLAFPFSPSDISVGEVYQFSIYHLLKVEDPCQYSQTQYFQLEEGIGHEV